jgi:glucose/arabinose dehydrogenase
MMIYFQRFYALLFFLLVSCSFQNGKEGHEQKTADGEKEPSYEVNLKLIASDIESPVGMATPLDGSNRIFIIEQTGTIRIIKNGKLLEAPFLDVSSKIEKLSGMYSEKGLLGLAFHPGYKNNGKFYVYYSAPTAIQGMDNKSVIAEYSVSPNPDAANTTGRIILEIEEPESNHNGGQLAFGPDGFLYIGVGDGGGAGDKHGTTGNGQNINTLLGKILRIDVNTETGYKNPADNPFVGKDGKDEIFAYGLRNPWRFSFDRSGSKLFCADVGQNEYEEVDIIEKGKNYGWRIMEGMHCYNPSKDCNKTGLMLPIYEYDHNVGKSVIGGYVYRGGSAPDMQGKYIFGDWTGKIFMLLQQPATGSWEQRSITIQNNPDQLYINSFGEDANGELYVLGQNSIGPRKAGKLYQLVFQ